MGQLTCFGANDIRGRLGHELNEDIAYRIARSFAITLNAETVVLGHDIRNSSKGLATSIARGLRDEGCDCLDLGLSGTEEMYFATSHFEADGGICVTASHNPADYNGIKMVGAGSAPLHRDQEFAQIKRLAQRNSFQENAKSSATIHQDISERSRLAYVERVLSFVDIDKLRPLKILVNAGHGTAGPTFDVIAKRLQELGAPLTFERLFHTPDASFPQGIPNPLLPDNRPVTAQALQNCGADFAVAWDGDFDRCFFFDHTGDFVDGEYIVGLLGASFLQKKPDATIIHDPRIIWNTQDIVASTRGRAVQSRTGHSYVKHTMRDTNAVYGGEMSSHHYFADFCYCDSGMIPWLLVAQQVSQQGPLRDLIQQRKAAFPSSGELNFHLTSPKKAIEHVRKTFEILAQDIDEMDGLSMDMGRWRFNLRCSNTEPLVRLNVESRGDRLLVSTAVEQISQLLSSQQTMVTLQE